MTEIQEHHHRRLTDDIADVSEEIFKLVESTSDPEKRIGYLIQLKSINLLGKNTDATIKATSAINKLVSEFSGHVAEDEARKHKGRGMILAARVFWGLLIVIGSFTQYLIIDKVESFQQTNVEVHNDVATLTKKIDNQSDTINKMLRAEMMDEKHKSYLLDDMTK